MQRHLVATGVLLRRMDFEHLDDEDYKKKLKAESPRLPSSIIAMILCRGSLCINSLK